MDSINALMTSMAIALTCSMTRADDYPRNPDIDILHYAFTLSLSDVTDSIVCETQVRLQFENREVDSFALDLIGRDQAESETGMTVLAVTRDGSDVSFQHADDRLNIALATAPYAGEVRTYVIKYEGQPADGLIIGQNKHGDRTFFGDNFPDRARHWLPTLDHPYDKATCEFIITAPSHYQVIASGLLVEETDQPGTGARLTHWRQDNPISTYMMVVGAAHFAVQNLGEIREVPLSTWVYAQDRDAGFIDFSEAGKAIEFFAEYIGPFPYHKLANVQSKTRYGGMENPGNIFYGEGVVTGNQSIEGLITHEIAHQWFGDAVTTADWNHVWLSEGFATYFTHLYNEELYGRDRMVEGLKSDKQRIIAYRDRHPDLAIVDDRIPVNRILSTNTYQKGGWVLHMLRRVIGDENFKASLREYFKQYRHANALTEDFQAVVEDISGQDLDWFFKQWIYQPGLPKYEYHWSYDESVHQVEVTIKQVQTDATRFDMPLDIGIVLEAGSDPMMRTIRVSQVTNRFSFSVPREPLEVILDPHTWVLMEMDSGRR